MKKYAENEPAARYIWEKRGLNYFVCIGQAEVSRPRLGKPWVVLIPRIIIGETGGKSWGLLSEGDGARSFRSVKEAMESAELYLDLFNQYHETHSSEWVDISAGNIGISGAQI